METLLKGKKEYEKSMRFDGIPEFRPNKVALMEAILFLIDQAAGIGRRLSKGEIVKCLFLADGAHLTEYGRPITARACVR